LCLDVPTFAELGLPAIRADSWVGVYAPARTTRRRGQNSTQTSIEILDAVRMLAHMCSDRLIAALLNRNKLLTVRNSQRTRERVTALRTSHDIPCYQAEQRDSEPSTRGLRPPILLRNTGFRFVQLVERSFWAVSTTTASGCALPDAVTRRIAWAVSIPCPSSSAQPAYALAIVGLANVRCRGASKVYG
jgi:hypothetical protein